MISNTVYVGLIMFLVFTEFLPSMLVLAAMAVSLKSRTVQAVVVVWYLLGKVLSGGAAGLMIAALVLNAAHPGHWLYGAVRSFLR